jgi:hypothetical protein
VRKPSPTDYDLVAIAAVRGLPENISDRREVLAALVAVLPDGEKREEVVLMREDLLTHERHQRKFLELFNGGAK